MTGYLSIALPSTAGFATRLEIIPLYNSHLGEDIIQDAMVGVIRHLDTFRSESRFTTWASKFAMHAAASELRRAGTG